MWREDVDADEGRGEAFEAFSRIHLGTSAERAVFRRFAGEPDGCWSDAEIALAARVDPEEVSWALERFVEAGILEAVEEGRYRWKPQLRYIFDGTDPAGDRRDPVCGMPVAEDAPHRAEDVFGRIERFCSERCVAAFLAWPLVFTRHPDSEADHLRLEVPPGR